MVLLHPSAILRVDSKKDGGMNYDQTSAVNFLLYSTMMATLEDGTEAAVDAAIKRAYRDASNHVLSGYDESKGHEAIKDGLMNLRDIDSTPNQGSFDEWHEKTCEAICTKGYKATSKIAQRNNIWHRSKMAQYDVEVFDCFQRHPQHGFETIREYGRCRRRA